MPSAAPQPPSLRAPIFVVGVHANLKKKKKERKKRKKKEKKQLLLLLLLLLNFSLSSPFNIRTTHPHTVYTINPFVFESEMAARAASDNQGDASALAAKVNPSGKIGRGADLGENYNIEFFLKKKNKKRKKTNKQKNKQANKQIKKTNFHPPFFFFFFSSLSCIQTLTHSLFEQDDS